MANPQLSLLQQYGRFLVSGVLVFTLAFWGLSQIFISSQDAHLYFTAARLILKACIHQPFSPWLQNFETAFLPFFLRQPALLSCYLISGALAWLTAFLHDTKVLRKENTL